MSKIALKELYLNKEKVEFDIIGPLSPGKPQYIPWEGERPAMVCLVTDNSILENMTSLVEHHNGVFITDYSHDWHVGDYDGSQKLKYHGPGVSFDCEGYYLVAVRN